MTDDFDIGPIVSAALYDAVSFIDDDIGPDRAKAIDAYFGRPYGDEQEGRSKVVSRDVADMVSAAMPSLMRIFFGPEHVVEFEPYGPEDTDEAEQKTDYVNYIVTTDNDGFEVFYAAIKDALRSKVGLVKSWWDDAEETTMRSYTGLDENALTALLDDLNGASKAEIVEASEDDAGISVKIKLTKKRDRVRIAAVPPEEFLISRDAVSIDDATLVAHRSLKTRSDLLAMGYSEEDVEFGASEDLDWNEERLARNPSITEGVSSNDPSMRRVLYVEAYIRTDGDGDGIAELHRVCTIGSTYKVVSDEVVDDHPFSDFHCDPEPHTFFGESLADKVMDVQLIKTRLLRGGLDGLSQSIFPRTIVGQNGNIEDAMNTEVGAILRAKGDPASAYSFQSVPDTSKAVLPFLSYMDELRENRTGMSKVSMGLDAQALQNTTAAAAESNFTRSQERIELYARIMASGMRKLFRRIAQLVSENQRAERMVKLRNKWVPIDPRSWATSMNVICNVGLGGGSQQQKIMGLNMIASRQEQILLTAGQNNPIVTLKQYHHTLSKIVQEMGYKNPDAFFSDPEGEEAQQRMANQPPPPPDPAVLEAQAKLQIEQAKVDGAMRIAQIKASSEIETVRAVATEKAALARQEAEERAILKRQEHEEAMLLLREKNAAELAHKREVASFELEMKREEMLIEADLKRAAIAAKSEASTTVSGPEMGGDAG